MQFRMPTATAAGFCAALLLLGNLCAQQTSSSSSTSTPGSSSSGVAGPASASPSNASEADLKVKAPDVPADKSNGSIRVAVNEVIVPVTVTDDKGRFAASRW